MKRLLKKLCSGLALAATLALGVVAALFITACGGNDKAPTDPAPPEPPKTQAPKAAKGDTGQPKSADTPDKPKVDRKEVEQGQPLPRNYLE